jgi:glycosyltransferase involved in cell wall biosynthesis
MYKNLKIGYVPYASDLSHPDDRRRFPYFAERNGIAYEIANSNKVYDIVLLPAPANLSKWLLYKKRNPKTRFIFEMVDSLIYQSDTFNKLFKGIGRFVTGKETLPYATHRNLLIKWLETANVVMCSSPKVKSEVETLNRNVVLSLDYLEHEYKFLKKDYSISGKMKLIWEGQGVILPHFLHFKDVFKEVSSFCELHIVTSEKYPKYGKFVNKSVDTILKQLPIETTFHKWDIYKNQNIFSNSDCAIIPLNKNDVYGWHKPANKLLSFWFSGLPVLTSDTPAYTELINKASGNTLCSSTNEWIEKIHLIRNMKAEERESVAKNNFLFAQSLFSDERHDLTWLNMFENIHSNAQIITPVLRQKDLLRETFWGKGNLANKPSFG